VALQSSPAPSRTFLTEGADGGGQPAVASAASGPIRSTQGKPSPSVHPVASGSGSRTVASADAASSAIADSVAHSAYAPRPTPPAKLPPAQPKRAVSVQRTPLPERTPLPAVSRSRSQSGNLSVGVSAPSGNAVPSSLEKWTAELLASMPKGLVGLDVLDDL
jgi:hypothetical protein